MTTMKVVVFFDIFGAIGATVLIITFERIELEGCACAHTKSLGEQNGSINPDDARNLSKRDRNAANT